MKRKHSASYQCPDFKIVLIGEVAVGKSCLMQRFTREQYYPEHIPTVGVEFGDRIVGVGEARVKLQLWDTAGQEKYRSVVRNFYRHSSVVLLVYDITKRKSMEMLTDWLNDARDNSPRGVMFVLVGTHIDKESQREVTKQQATLWAQSEAISQVFELSSLTGMGVNEMFEQLASKLLDRKARLRQEKMHVAEVENSIKTKESIITTVSNTTRKKCCGE